MRKIIITDNENAQKYTQALAPRVIVRRSDFVKVGFAPDEVEDVILDGTDVEILECFKNAKMRYASEPINFDGNIDDLTKAFKSLSEYTIPVETSSVDDDYVADSGFLTPSYELPAADEFYEIPMAEQIAMLQPILDGKKIGAGTVAELSSQLVEICRNHNLFVHDNITGLFKSVFVKKPLFGEEQANTIFDTHFCDKLAIRTESYKINKDTGEPEKKISYRKITPTELKLLWKNVCMYSTFNSRKVFYDSIPQWDGEERIATFMKKYFECDANPNFFLLMMTCIIAKFVNPRINTPYFFDIVAKTKGIGKSYLCKRLLGGKYYGFLKMSKNRGMSDFFVDAYDGNNVLVVDDENTWCGNGFDKISYDELKALVTATVDKFSRKNKQPEEHDRSFIIVRTSNFTNQVFSTNERRQIIFECHLPEKECRIKKLPDSFFEQMLAEAKEYFEKHGVYEMTDEDWADVKEANLENYNWETPENFLILDYVQAVRDDQKKWGIMPVAQKFSGRIWGNYKNYVKYCQDNHKDKYMLQQRGFWRSVESLAELAYNRINVISDTKYSFADGGCARMFEILPLENKSPDEINLDDIPDMPA